MTTIYHLLSYWGRLNTGLGAALLKRGYDVSSRETIGNTWLVG